jgi:hypothetical protein
MMVVQINKILQDRLAKSRMNPTSMSARLVIVNQLMLSAGWYVLTLWSGTEADLKKLEKKVVRFLWAEHNYQVHHRVNYQTIIRFKHQGGLGYISIVHQVDSLASKMII